MAGDIFAESDLREELRRMWADAAAADARAVALLKDATHAAVEAAQPAIDALRLERLQAATIAADTLAAGVCATLGETKTASAFTDPCGWRC